MNFGERTDQGNKCHQLLLFSMLYNQWNCPSFTSLFIKYSSTSQDNKSLTLSGQQYFILDLKSDLVKDYWNELETQLVGFTDEIVPYKLFEFKTVIEPIPAMIKHKINERKRLLKSNRHCTTMNKTERIKVLSKDIKFHFNNAKALKIRR